MAYATYTTDSDSRLVIAMVFPTAEAATAAVDTSKGELAYADALSDDVEPGWYIVEGAAQPNAPETAAETLAAQRGELKALWRAREGEFRAAWAAHTADKASDYQRWLELNCRAISQDANLSDDTLRELLMAEAAIPGADWHVQHSPTDWAAIWPDPDAQPPRDWSYHSTADGSGRHSRGGVAQASMAVNQNSDFDYVHYLHGE